MNRNELQAAHERWDREVDTTAWHFHDLMSLAEIFREGSLRWLDLQPYECGPCGGSGRLHEVHDDGGWSGYICKPCHGSGRVYKTETVDRIVRALRAFRLSRRPDETAIAVLDALNETPPDKESE